MEKHRHCKTCGEILSKVTENSTPFTLYVTSDSLQICINCLAEKGVQKIEEENEN